MGNEKELSGCAYKIVHSAMRMGWTRGHTGIYFLRLQAMAEIPMRFTENIYMTCIPGTASGGQNGSRFVPTFG